MNNIQIKAGLIKSILRGGSKEKSEAGKLKKTCGSITKALKPTSYFIDVLLNIIASWVVNEEIKNNENKRNKSIVQLRAESRLLVAYALVSALIIKSGALKGRRLHGARRTEPLLGYNLKRISNFLGPDITKWIVVEYVNLCAFFTLRLLDRLNDLARYYIGIFDGDIEDDEELAFLVDVINDLTEMGIGEKIIEMIKRRNTSGLVNLLIGVSEPSEIEIEEHLNNIINFIKEGASNNEEVRIRGILLEWINLLLETGSGKWILSRKLLITAFQRLVNMIPAQHSIAIDLMQNYLDVTEDSLLALAIANNALDIIRLARNTENEHLRVLVEMIKQIAEGEEHLENRINALIEYLRKFSTSVYRAIEGYSAISYYSKTLLTLLEIITENKNGELKIVNKKLVKHIEKTLQAAKALDKVIETHVLICLLYTSDAADEERV